MTEEALADLENNKDVLSIGPNHPVSATLDRAHYSTNANTLQNYYLSINRWKAKGIGVAILDSGINASHPNFKAWASTASRIVYSETFVGGDTND